MKIFHLSDFLPGNGKDDTEAFARCFEAARQESADAVQIIIAPGNYHLDAIEPIPLCSNLTVLADGANFYFPEDLTNPRHRTMFAGAGISRFTWKGGCFHGHVYRIPLETPVWEPDACSRCIALECTADATCSDLHFTGIHGDSCAGSVLSVYGRLGSEGNNPADGVEVTDCHFSQCGKFMWDYGFLWERVTFPELFTPEDVKVANCYISKENISGPIRFLGDFIQVEACPPFKPEPRLPLDTISFAGTGLPPEILPGKAYYVLEEKEGRIRFSNTPGGAPVTCTPAQGNRAFLFRNLFDLFHWAYAPQGQGPGKGGLDLVCCRNVTVNGCSFSANGDTMHIKDSTQVVFSNNRIEGSRMGAFFLAFNCSYVTACGNVVNGTNGSRVLTVEKGCHDVVISGNVFTGGGRGCWFNNNENLILSENVFRNNVCKGIPTSGIGRHSPFSGSFERYPELYFAHARKGYGNIIVRSNVFEATPTNTEPTLLFQEHGHDLILENNLFVSGTRQLSVMPGVSLHCAGNIGISETVQRDVAEPL